MQQLQASKSNEEVKVTKFDPYARLFLFLRVLKKLGLGFHWPEDREDFIQKFSKHE